MEKESNPLLLLMEARMEEMMLIQQTEGLSKKEQISWNFSIK